MSAPAPSLPAFIEPMLASPGSAFDAEDYLFEVKWDGVRALAFIEAGSYRLLNRRKIDITARFPEFAPLATLPPGTVLDGEVVVLKEGKPDFGLLQSRDHARTPLKVAAASKNLPATYIIFDILYDGFRSLMAKPLLERRERLANLLAAAPCDRFALSQHVLGSGKTFFTEVCRSGLEGVVAKRLNSRYQPGKRSDAWIKIKRSQSIYCAIIGFVPRERRDFRNLILASNIDGELRYAGKVGSGFDMALRDQLNDLLYSRLRPKPLVPCKLKGKWIEPGLYCLVSCMERTARGEFRAPVFEELRVE